MKKMEPVCSKNPLSRLLAAMLFDHMSLNITFPILTLLFFDGHSSLFDPGVSHAFRSFWYGICMAIPHVMVIFAAPILSGLSDHRGRKPILCLTLFAALLFSLLSSVAVIYGSLFLLLVARIIQGLFSRSNPIAQAAVGDLGDDDRKVVRMASLQLFISLGAFIGPVIGGYFAVGAWFAKYNFAMPFFIASVIALIGLLITIFLFKETLKSPLKKDRFSFRSIKTVFKKPGVGMISLFLLLSQITWSTYYQFIPPVLKTEFHFSAHMIGWFVGLVALWLAVATAIGVRLLRRYFSIERMLFFSIVAVLIGTILTTFVISVDIKAVSLLWISAVPTAMGDVIAYSCLTAMYSSAVESYEQGRVMGVCFIIVSIVWASTGFFGGLLSAVSVILPMLIAPFGVLLLLVVLVSRKI